MADPVESQQLEKRVETVEPDPIADRSMSGSILVFSLLLVGTLIWSLYDEVFGQRPWKTYQRDFVTSYTKRLERVRERQRKEERGVKESPEYQELEEARGAAWVEVEPRVKEIDARVREIDQQVSDITDPFQNARAWISAKSYTLETTEGEAAKNRLRNEIQNKRKEKIEVTFSKPGGSSEDKSLDFDELETLYNSLRDERARLLAERVELTKAEAEARKKRDDYLEDALTGLTPEQISRLIDKMNKFDFSIKQLHVASANLVDRCESCHLGVREPVTLTAKDMGSPAFVSHPEKDLLRIHDPEKFGCSTCHGGNGRGTTSVEKAHGRYKHWLWPLYYKENVQAGCNQCHNKDRVTPMAEVLNRGKDLFQNRGCFGCHRYEGYDRETEGLSANRQAVKQLELDRLERLREIRETTGAADAAESNEEARRLLNRADSLRQIVAQIDTQIDERDQQAKYLMQDQKKVGPNLKEIKAKLRKEWLPVWLRDPQAFRPGTKMPTYRLEDDDIRAIAAFVWQSAIDAKAPSQPQGDANRGKELFKTTGCLACHSIDGRAIDMGNQRIGGEFAADLSRVGEKTNYDYIVRWVHNPRQRLAPYSPSLKRDLTPDDYAKKNLPFIFDDEHSTSPVDGRELQIQNMTVMPNFRLSDQDARDIGSFLMNLKRRDLTLPDASFLDDGSLRARGEQLVRMYGCAGCHEIKGLEEEQRIGTELTPEGSKPIERLDFALLTEVAKKGEDPFTGGESSRRWYDHKGFFEHKLRSPGIYDKGKEKPREERLRMPNIFLQSEDVTALTTFLLGSVVTSLPEAIQYNPTGQKKDVQEGWWVIQKYNCMGCHNVLIGQETVLMGLPMYQGADGKEQLPPRLTTEGARVNPDWLLRFLKDPSLASPAERAALTDQSLGKQPGANRNGVRQYLRARMPTFNFSPNELQALVNFFMGASSQQMPYIAERQEPLTGDEQAIARSIFTSPAAPCLKCHMTGDPAHDIRATAPNFLIAAERLKPDWTKRWMLEPQLISPGTSMPSGLFERDATHERWMIKGVTSPLFQTYEKDHADLLVRYMFQITAEEQRRLVSSGSAGGAAPASRTSAANRTSRRSLASAGAP
jgi:mono/diheme cytochrome c family protein